MRIDVWDADQAKAASDLGFQRGLEESYELLGELGKGGFGLVQVARCKQTGEELACKAIAKQLPDICDPARNAKHQANIKREVAVLQALKGSLNVANIEQVFEDDEYVYIVMEYCKGGELFHEVGELRYTEDMVARIMQAVLRTLVQCHESGILHRDIKPGNFMLRDKDESSPIKAIDFGMAVFFDSKNLPKKDLGLEGTPWFMAPEVLQSEVGPKADTWAAGVMAFQLLTGRLPFDDHRNPLNPSVSMIWKSILTEKLSFERSYWKETSETAKDFVRQLLERDVSKRPTAQEALQHEWLRGEGDTSNRHTPLHSDVVQRLQRYGQSSLFKRNVLQMIAQEILPLIKSSQHGAAIFSGFSFSSASLASMVSDAGSSEGPMIPCSVCGRLCQGASTMAGLSQRGLTQYKRYAAGRLPHGAARAPGSSAHGPSKTPALKHALQFGSWQNLASLVTAAGGGLMGPQGTEATHGPGRSHHGSRHLPPNNDVPQPSHITDIGSSGRAAHQHGDTATGAEAKRTMRRATIASLMPGQSRGVLSYPAEPAAVHGGNVFGSGRAHQTAVKRINSMVLERQLSKSTHGGSAALDAMAKAVSVADHVLPIHKAMSSQGLWRDDFELPSAAMGQGGEDSVQVRPGELSGIKRALSQDFCRPVCDACRDAAEGAGTSSGSGVPANRTHKRNYSDPELPAVKVSDVDVLRKLLDNLEFSSDSMYVGDLADNLIDMGFQVSRNEAIHLLQQMGLGDDNGQITKAQFLASQIDWQVFQSKYKDIFLDKAKQVFSDIDTDNSGSVSVAEIASVLRKTLPDEDVEEAVQHAFWEAGLLEDMSVSCRDAEIPFDGFLSALGRWHSLDLFEGRNHNLNHLGRSSRDGIDTSGRDVTVRGAKMALSMLGEIKE